MNAVDRLNNVYVIGAETPGNWLTHSASLWTLLGDNGQRPQAPS